MPDALSSSYEGEHDPLQTQPDPVKPTQISNLCITKGLHNYTDGSVVIRMQGRTYKLHWSVLASNSTRFDCLYDDYEQGILLLELDSDSHLPIVNVDGDPDDFVVLLDALYEVGKYVLSQFSLLPS